MSLLMEIGRRKVSQVAAVYAVVAWLIIQIVDVISGPLNLPEWFATVTIVFLGIGFPIALILAWLIDKTPQGMVVDKGASRAEAATPASSQRINFALQGLVLVAVGFLVIDQFLLDATTQNSAANQAVSIDSSNLSRRFQIDIGPTEPFGPGLSTTRIALTADGNYLAYITQVDGDRRLYLRDLTQNALREIAVEGSQDLHELYFSPDGVWLAYDMNEFRRVSLAGGAPQVISNARRGGTGVAWLDDGSMIFTPDRVQDGGYRLRRIATPGGEPELLSHDEDISSLTHSWPEVLPGESHLLFSARPRGIDIRDGYIGLLSLETGDTSTLIESGYNARYAPSGHIVFVRSGSIWAVPFELATMTITGEPKLVIDGVQTSGSRGSAAYAFSDDGLLVYLPGGDTRSSQTERRIVLVDRIGREEDLGAPLGNYAGVSVSGDGQRIAVTENTDENIGNIGVFDAARRSLDRWATPGSNDTSPVWTQGDNEVIYSQLSPSGSGIYSRASDGSDEPRLLFSTTAGGVLPETLFPNDELLLFSQRQDGFRGLYALVMDGTAVTEAIYEPGFDVDHAALSPDGQWFAYTSDESGQEEIYVRPFPDVLESRYKVSIGGGEAPAWSATGDELFYQGRTSMVSVAITTEPEFSAGQPNILFSHLDYRDDRWDLHPDGGFVMIKQSSDDESAEERTHLVAIDNWFEELKRLAPSSD